MELSIAVGHLKAIADETRLRLLGLVADRERSVGELAEIVDLKEPTISHHLRKLSAAGLVSMRREGTTHFYRLDGDALRSLSRDLFSSERVAAMAGRAEGDAWERRVLATYVREDGRLEKIPETRKKRDVVLRWLAEDFEGGRRYTEKEVNETIRRRHEDCATLRRELVGARLMAREAGEYWRLPVVPAEEIETH